MEGAIVIHKNDGTYAADVVEGVDVGEQTGDIDCDVADSRVDVMGIF